MRYLEIPNIYPNFVTYSNFAKYIKLRKISQNLSHWEDFIQKKSEYQNILFIFCFDKKTVFGRQSVKEAGSGVMGGRGVTNKYLKKKHLEIRGGYRQKLFVGGGVKMESSPLPSSTNFNLHKPVENRQVIYNFQACKL